VLTIIRPYPFQRAVGSRAWSVKQVIAGVRTQYSVIATTGRAAIDAVRAINQGAQQ
jgi:hypothetical protein